MIVRVFRAQIHAGRERDFERFVDELGMPTVRRQKGCVEAFVGRQFGGGSEFIIVSRWESLEALQRFAGPRWQDPFIRPEEADLIREVACEHYQEPTAESP